MAETQISWLDLVLKSDKDHYKEEFTYEFSNGRKFFDGAGFYTSGVTLDDESIAQDSNYLTFGTSIVYVGGEPVEM